MKSRIKNHIFVDFNYIKPDFTNCPFCHGDANAFEGGNDACECNGTGLMELEPGVGARRLAIDVERSIAGITYAPIAEFPLSRNT